MTNFLEWWYTNSDGNEYMTLLGCSLNDLPVVVATIALCGLVIYNYGTIAYQAFAQSKGFDNSITKKYLIEKMYVFIFCAITGYGYTILSAFINPYKFRILLLIILAIWSYKFSRSVKRTKVIRRIYEGEQLIQEKVKAYRKLKEVREITKLVNVPDGKSEFISFDTIKAAFPVGSEEDLGSGKIIYGLDQFKRNGLDVVILRGKMPKGETYTLNHHDCKEFVLPIEGLAIEMFSEKEFDILKVFEIGESVKHGFVALEDFEFLSILIKNEGTL